MNEIVRIQVAETEGPDGPTAALMINLDIGSPGDIDVFLAEVIHQFKMRRTLAPPNTSMMLISIFGDISASDFVGHWQRATTDDGITQAYLSLMSVADVIQIDEQGDMLSADSLLPEEA